MHKTTLLIIILCLICWKPLFGASTEITVLSHVIKKVNHLAFGANMIAYDPATFESRSKEFFGYSNYGSGIWNPLTGKPVFEVIKLAKEAGITIARFPGGTGAEFYDWKKTIGPPQRRPNFLYGLDEFLKTCEQIGTDVVITLPYHTATSQDAADLVEYLNASDNGVSIWAHRRTLAGHSKPYNVKYFELGNEVYDGIAAKDILPADPEKYAKAYIKYKKAMKSVDSSIKLGAVTVNSGTSKGLSPWNEKVFKVAGHTIDYLIEHTYRPWYTANDNSVDTNKLFAATLTSLNEVDMYYKRLSTHFYTVTGRKKIPLAVTEYNGGFAQESPVPFRHSLGTALFNAGLLQIFLKPENNILMANYWQFVNSYWGMLKNDQYSEDKGSYIRRPNYYVMEMFHKHFGTSLIDTNVIPTESSCASLQLGNNLLSKTMWRMRPFSGAKILENKNIIEIDFTDGADTNFYHASKSAKVKANATYRFSGYLKTEGLADNEGICLEIQDGRGWDKTHSAASTGRVWGMTDWIRVEAEYTTMSDASDVNVMIRRISGKGPVKGKAFVRDVALVESYAYGTKGNDALSVSASISKDGKKMYILTLNKNVYADIQSTIRLSDFGLHEKIDAWTLNGPAVWATNEKDPSNVVIKHKIIEAASKQELSYTFPAHSLTSLEMNLR